MVASSFAPGEDPGDALPIELHSVGCIKGSDVVYIPFSEFGEDFICSPKEIREALCLIYPTSRPIYGLYNSLMSDQERFRQLEARPTQWPQELRWSRYLAHILDQKKRALGYVHAQHYAKPRI